VTHVTVVGGGIAGLAAAYELSGGHAGPGDDSMHVTVLDGSRFGGKLLKRTLDGRSVDVGPDGFLARRAEAVSLVTELGAESELEAVGAQGAWVFARGRLRRLPAGLAYGVPTQMRDLRTKEAIGLLGVAGTLRASVDLFAPRPASRSALPDRAIGPLVADKLGHRVVDVLVDPLVGGIHAGRVKDLSAAAVYPPVLAAGQRRGSIMRALKAGSGDAAGAVQGPAFMSLRAGVGSLPGLIESELSARGVDCRARTEVTAVRRGAAGQPRWTIEGTGEALHADAVILATPPASAAALLASLDADAASLVATIDTAGVAVVTLVFDEAAIRLPEDGTGILVPSGTARGDATYLTSAVTFLDRKWPHLKHEGTVLVRVSVGRIDDRRWEERGDDELVGVLTDELTGLVGLDAAASSSLVTRWPAAFPQYRVNHLVRVDGIEAAASSLGGLAVAGAAYRGVGIPACISSGRAAARNVRSWLAAQS
jgi:oxygen-dependent protoporphyrinogen oxidase